MELKGKQVLVTGADGFIGSHLVEGLVEKGCRVRAFAFYNSLSFWGWLEDIATDLRNLVEIFPGDIRDERRVEDALDNIDVVFHLAALIGIPYSYNAPRSYIDTNIIGTFNVLEAARQKDIQRVIVTSTSEVYGTAQYVPIDELHPLQGQSPYSASKIGADRLAESYWRSFNLPVIIVRPFNTYGPRQSARAIIPTIISQLLQGQKDIKLGNLSPTRDLNFVKDIVNGFIQLAECDQAVGEEVNIATQSEISMGDLARKLIAMINSNAHIVKDEKRFRPEHSEVERLLGANNKIQRLTNWAPKYTLENGLYETMEWLRVQQNLKRYKLEYNK